MGYSPLVEPAPDAFPLHYRSLYVPAGPDATLNQRLIRMGYEHVPGGNRPFWSEPPRITTEPVVGDLAKSIGRYYVAEQCYESTPYPTNEHDGTMTIECQVDYEPL